MTDTRIIAVSTACQQNPTMIMASVTSNAIHIAKMEPLTRTPAGILKALVTYSKLATKVGAELLVEDPTGLFLSFGRNLTLQQKDHTGKPVLVSAFEKYTSLQRIGAITTPAKLAGQFSIPDSIYNIKHNDTGAVSYEIDWERVKDPARLMLLVIHAGLCQTPYQSNFMENMLDNMVLEGDSIGMLECEEHWCGRVIKL
ncbi:MULTISPECIES: hypothetical protein [Shewanella]|uniref:hypothetical protein n=1 Tax=Shewanella TaxID=22 RepID=UPI001AAFA869|nr:hypothetical protein [Shewanella algae]MBO2580267.1 hypothetical protein [Shewanella algae]HDS1207853.1 hypothetical protein [Shewanella algae]